MAFGYPPSHRRPELQSEVCDLCGAIVGHLRLREPDVEGLRGFKVCDQHPFERRTQNAPSYNDHRGMSTPIQSELAERLEPIGGELWFLDPELEE
jgi:hypothetical protein